MTRIWVAMKDPGGTNAVWPVAEELKQRGHRILHIPNGKAVELLAEKMRDDTTLVCFAARNAELLLHWIDPEMTPHVYITSMCSEGGIGRNFIPIMRDMGIPTVAVQDYWGGALKVEFKDPIYWPDAICVPDELGREMVLDAWQGYDPNRVHITGQPAFDKLTRLDATSAEKKIWEFVIRAPKYYDVKFIVFAGQLKHTSSALRALVQSLNDLPYRHIVLVALQHPRFKNNAPEEIEPFEKACGEFKNGMLLRNHPDISTDEWVAASNLVVSLTSTVLATGAYFRKPCIAYLPPEIFQSELAANGFTFLPMAKVGACAVAESEEQLDDLAIQALHGEEGDPLQLLENQEKYFVLDGKNASRVADVAMSLVKK